MDIDLTTLTDEQLDELRVVILTEQERRANIAQIPATISELAAKYKEGGGDQAELLDAVSREQ